jgi:hypothetical protein
VEKRHQAVCHSRPSDYVHGPRGEEACQTAPTSELRVAGVRGPTICPEPDNGLAGLYYCVLYFILCYYAVASTPYCRVRSLIIHIIIRSWNLIGDPYERDSAAIGPVDGHAVKKGFLEALALTDGM